MSSRLRCALSATAVVLVVPILTGCPGDNVLCCPEFKPGATIQTSIGGSAQSQVAVQAVADFAGIASAAIDDLTTACRSISQDLDADKTKQEDAEAITDKQARMKAWCDLAVASITTAKGKIGGNLTIVAKTPQCQASVSAKASCQAKCSGTAKCDVKLHPPKCSGRLEVSCKGDCTAKAGAKLSCEGKCEGNCEGSCVADAGGVKCKGACKGTCEAEAGVAGSGIQADGTCSGMCKGTCDVVAPSASCNGSCNGTCEVKCSGTAEATVKCDGECKADFEPLKCEGKLEGGCEVDAKCDANCDASVSAKAECSPPEISVQITGAADLNAAGKLQATFEANLGVVLAFKARLQGMMAVTSTIAGSADAVVDIKAACILEVGVAAAAAVQDVGASFDATTRIVAAVGRT
jgi:hypothetical protein